MFLFYFFAFFFCQRLSTERPSLHPHTPQLLFVNDNAVLLYSILFYNTGFKSVRPPFVPPCWRRALSPRQSRSGTSCARGGSPPPACPRRLRWLPPWPGGPREATWSRSSPPSRRPGLPAPPPGRLLRPALIRLMMQRGGTGLGGVRRVEHAAGLRDVVAGERPVATFFVDRPSSTTGVGLRPICSLASYA